MPIEDLLRQETLEFTPMDGVFDGGQVEALIDATGFWFRDEIETDTYVVTPYEGLRDQYAAERKADPESGFPFMLLIEVAPDRIGVTPSPLPDLAPLNETFIRKLLQAFPCRVANESGLDLTGAAEHL